MPLVLHCGGKSVASTQLGAIKTPSATRSWVPIPHADFANLVRQSLVKSGFQITDEKHGISHEGNRYFGLLEISRDGEPCSDQYGLVVGTRNSHDQTFPASIAVGSRVFVCDNLSFSGEIVLRRKHTTFIKRDLPGIVAFGVAKIASLRLTQDQRFTAYLDSADLEDRDVHDFAVRTMDNGVVPSSKIMPVLEGFRNGSYRNGWGLFNAYTSVLKETNIATLPKRTITLHSMLDSLLGVSPSIQTIDTEVVG